MANGDVTVTSLGKNDLEAMEVNLRNHFEDIRDWQFPAGRDITQHDFFHSMDITSAARELANATPIDHWLFYRCMRGWITQQSQGGHFICTVCGRKSTVDVTAVQMRQEPHGMGICMCCLSMRGMPIKPFTDHAINDVFFQQVQKALYMMLPGEFRVDMLIDETATSDKQRKRPDTSIFITYMSVYTAMIIECDPQEKHLTDAINKRDNELLTAKNHLNLGHSCSMALVLRYDTAIHGGLNTRSNLLQNIWQITRLYAEISRNILVGQLRIGQERITGRLVLNYSEMGGYSIYGFRLHADQPWLRAMVSPLMQPNYAVTEEISGSAKLHEQRTILLEVMRGFESNRYIAFYYQRWPVIAFISDPAKAFSRCATAGPGSRTHVRYMFRPTQCSEGTIQVTPYTLRMGKELLASMIFFTRHRFTSQIQPYPYDLVPQRVNRPSEREKRPEDPDQGPGEIMAIADFLSKKMYF